MDNSQGKLKKTDNLVAESLKMETIQPISKVSFDLEAEACEQTQPASKSVPNVKNIEKKQLLIRPQADYTKNIQLNQPVFKFVIFGESGIGKTLFIDKLRNFVCPFGPFHVPSKTDSFNLFNMKRFNKHFGTNLQLSILDTEGRVFQPDIVQFFCEIVDCVILAFHVEMPATFEALPSFVKRIRKYTRNNRETKVCFVLLGLHSCQFEHHVKVVSQQEIKDFQTNYKFDYYFDEIDFYNNFHETTFILANDLRHRKLNSRFLARSKHPWPEGNQSNGDDCCCC